jgi:hypothetical protein
MSGAAKLVYDMANGKKVPYWTVLPAPLVTKADIGTYQSILDRLSVNFRAAVNPDLLRATPTATK